MRYQTFIMATALSLSFASQAAVAEPNPGITQLYQQSLLGNPDIVKGLDQRIEEAAHQALSAHRKPAASGSSIQSGSLLPSPVESRARRMGLDVLRAIEGLQPAQAERLMDMLEYKVPHRDGPSMQGDLGPPEVMALSGWALYQGPSGYFIQHKRDIQSRLDIEEGMILGGFGEVVAIHSDGVNIHAELATGDRISGQGKAPGIGMMAGIPTLETLEQEIGQASTASSAKTASASALAVRVSLRPLPRPESIEEDIISTVTRNSQDFLVGASAGD